jgi:predicted restriction endonuclease
LKGKCIRPLCCHAALLDAAHIILDTEPQGEPTVRNGLALCKIHHAAYDRKGLTSFAEDTLIPKRYMDIWAHVA